MFPLAALVASWLQTVEAPARPSSTPSGHSSQPALSHDGEWVVFCSTAPDLVPDDTDGGADIFLRSRSTGTTVRISDNSSTTAQHPAISGDGNWITYWHGPWFVLHERATQQIRVLCGDADGGNVPGARLPASMSFDGARVAFVGTSGCGAGAQLWDREKGALECISVPTGGGASHLDASEARISASGRFVVFCSSSSLPEVSPPTLKRSEFGYWEEPTHVLVRDLERGITEYASRSATDALGFGDFRQAFVSDDGRFVAFNCGQATFGLENNIGFLNDRLEGRAGRLLDLSRAVPRDAVLEVRWLSRDGATAILSSTIPNLDPQAAPVARQKFYSFDRASSSFRRLDLAALDAAGGDDYPFFSVSGDGSTAVISSARSTLVPDDHNNSLDVFTVSLVDGSVELSSAASRK